MALSRLPPEDLACTEMVHTIFGPSVGSCFGSFPCTYSRQHGRIYVASRAVLFYSNIFGFERRLCIPLSEVTEIKLYRSTSIWISMMDGEDFVFKSLSDRERIVFAVETLIGHVLPPESPTIQEESGPPSTSGIHIELESPKQKCDSRIRAQSCPVEIHPVIKFDVDTTDPSQSEQLLSPESTGRKTSNGEVSIATYTTENLLDDWKKEKQRQEAHFKERAVDGVQLKCSLCDFFDLFLADDAPHSIQSYQEQKIGDTQVKITKWELDDDDRMRRTISFHHPIANGFGVGPSSTKVTKFQSLQRYGEFGLSLTSKTTVSGIPGSDSFHVADCWLFEQTSTEVICFCVLHETVFTKRTVFKRLIENSTKAEIVNWFKGYLVMLADVLEGQRTDNTVISVNNFADTPQKNERPSVNLNVILIIVVLAFFGQNYMLNAQLRQLHDDLRSVQNQHSAVMQVMQEILDRLGPLDKKT